MSAMTKGVRKAMVRFWNRLTEVEAEKSPRPTEEELQKLSFDCDVQVRSFPTASLSDQLRVVQRLIAYTRRLENEEAIMVDTLSDKDGLVEQMRVARIAGLNKAIANADAVLRGAMQWAGRMPGDVADLERSVAGIIEQRDQVETRLHQQRQKLQDTHRAQVTELVNDCDARVEKIDREYKASMLKWTEGYTAELSQAKAEASRYGEALENIVDALGQKASHYHVMPSDVRALKERHDKAIELLRTVPTLQDAGDTREQEWLQQKDALVSLSPGDERVNVTGECHFCPAPAKHKLCTPCFEEQSHRAFESGKQPVVPADTTKQVVKDRGGHVFHKRWCALGEDCIVCRGGLEDCELCGKAEGDLAAICPATQHLPGCLEIRAALKNDVCYCRSHEVENDPRNACKPTCDGANHASDCVWARFKR